MSFRRTGITVEVAGSSGMQLTLEELGFGQFLVVVARLFGVVRRGAVIDPWAFQWSGVLKRMATLRQERSDRCFV